MGARAGSGSAKCGTGLRQSADLSAESALAAEFPGGRRFAPPARTAENARKAMGTRKTKKIIHVLANAIRRCSSVKIQYFFVQRIHLFQKDEIALFDDARGRLNMPE